MEPDDEAFRAALASILERSGLSRRRLSQAMGRDPGYVAASLDPTRPSRARPTPADLVRASDHTGIPFVELIEALWGIPRARLLGELGVGLEAAEGFARLTSAQRAAVGDFIGFLAGRHGDRPARRR